MMSIWLKHPTPSDVPAIIYVASWPGEGKDDAIARHMAENPEDSHASLAIVYPACEGDAAA